MNCNAEVRGNVLYIDWDPVQCEYVKVFALSKKEEPIEVATVKDAAFTTISNIAKGMGTVYVQAWADGKMIDESEKTQYVSTGFGEYSDEFDSEYFGTEGFTDCFAKPSYNNMVRITWKYGARVDGFEVCALSKGDCVSEVTNGNINCVLIPEENQNESYFVKPYLNTLTGKEYLRQSSTFGIDSKVASSPKVTVIIPVANAEAYLPDCVDSILASSLSGFEIIIVSQGSEDKTVSMAKWYAKKHSNIRLISNPSIDKGTEAALKKAHGKYIFFVNVFDRIYPDTLEKYYDTAEKTDADIVFSRIRIKDYFDYYNDASFKFANEEKADTEEYLEAITNPNFLDSFKWNKMYRKELIKKFSYVFWDYADSAFLPFIFSHAALFSYIDESLYEKNALLHDAEFKAILDESDQEDMEEFWSEGIKFFYKYSNEKYEARIKEIALMQKEVFEKQSGNDISFLALEAALESYDNNERKELEEAAMKKAKRTQNLVKWILLGMVAAMAIIRLLSLLMKGV